MPTYKGVSCSLLRTSTENNGKSSLTLKEHQIDINHAAETVQCYVEVTPGTFEVELTVPNLESDHILVRIEIDNTPRVQRLVQLSHKGVSKLLRFNGTEHCENATWYSHEWAFKPIALTKMLRTNKTHDGFGSIAVMIFRVKDVVRLEEGSFNHDISSWVVKKGLWLNPTIPMDDFQDKRLTQVVMHSNNGAQEIKEGDRAPSAQCWAIQYALRHDWNVVDEADGASSQRNGKGEKPFAKFILQYREKDKIPDLNAELGFPSTSDSTRRKRERSLSDSISGVNSSLRQSLGDAFDLTTDEGIAALDHYVQELKAEQRVKKKRIQTPELRNQLVSLKAKYKVARDGRLMKINEISVTIDEKEEELKLLMAKADDLVQKHTQATGEEDAELNQLEQELDKLERQDDTRRPADSKVTASREAARGYTALSKELTDHTATAQAGFGIPSTPFAKVYNLSQWQFDRAMPDSTISISSTKTRNDVSEGRKGKQKAGTEKTSLVTHTDDDDTDGEL